MIPNLENYTELISKLEFEFQRYKDYNHTYALLDCLMGLNALPKWIVKTADIPDKLKLTATEKISIMKGP